MFFLASNPGEYSHYETCLKILVLIKYPIQPSILFFYFDLILLFFLIQPFYFGAIMKSMKLVLFVMSLGAVGLCQAQTFPKVSDGLLTPQKLSDRYSTQKNNNQPINLPADSLSVTPLQAPIIQPSIELPAQDLATNYRYPNTIISEKTLPEGPLLIAQPINNQWTQQYYENNTFTPSIATRYPAYSKIHGESLQDPWILQLRIKAQSMGYSNDKINLEMSRQTPSQFAEWLKRVND